MTELDNADDKIKVSEEKRKKVQREIFKKVNLHHVSSREQVTERNDLRKITKHINMTDYRINGLRERNGIDGGDPRSGFGGRGVVTRSVNDNSTYDISRGRGRGRKKEEEVNFIRDALTQVISARK